MRKVNGTASTVVTFIAPDDDAIGDTSPEAYEKYVETANAAHLKLNGEPAKYHLRLLSTKAWQRLTGIFRLLSRSFEGEDGEVKEKTVDFNAEMEEAFQLEMNLRLAYREIINECVVGCKDHPHVDRINEDGSFEYTLFNWRVGDRPPEGVLESIAEDANLVSAIVNFLMKISSLTDKEKNR